MTIDSTVDGSTTERRSKTLRVVMTMTCSLSGPTTFPHAPTDEEKFTYYGRQHRWYIWARTFATLSAATSLLFFSNTSVLTWWFWIPFSIFASYMVLTHYCTTRPRRISLVDHLAITELWRPDRYPSVDVFLPCAGEDLDVLDNTYMHVRQMEYPGEVNVYVLDDGDARRGPRRCPHYGFHYYVRPNRGHMKKAGNLKYGFDHSDGDLIIIFDADFCPRPDFITSWLRISTSTRTSASSSRRSSSTPTGHELAAALRRHGAGELLPVGSGLT